MTNEKIKNNSGITLISDSEWSVIDGVACQVVDFVPLASVRNGKVCAISKTTPYASVIVKCRKFPESVVTGYVTHKMDFMHLWAAFKDRTLKQDEEVVLFWSKQNYKWYAKFVSAFMPRLWVMVCPKGAYELMELMADKNYRPDLLGFARLNATLPIIEWKPDVMAW